MKDVAERLRTIKNGIGRSRFTMKEVDSVEDMVDRLDNLESAVGSLIDLMIEAAEEDTHG